MIRQATTTLIVVTRGAATVTETVLRRRGVLPAARSSPQDDTDLRMLKAVQAYLSSLSRRPIHDDVEHDSWDRFYEQYNPFIRRVVQSSLRRRIADADTDDCTQQVWAELITKLGTLNYDSRRGPFRAWLFTFVRRQAIRFIRRQSRQFAQQLADPGATLADRDGDPRMACQRQEDRQLVRHMLAVLRTRVSEVNYQVVHLRWIDGQNSAEIAARVNMTQDQVRYRLQRMKRKLRTLIAPHIAALPPTTAAGQLEELPRISSENSRHKRPREGNTSI